MDRGRRQSGGLAVPVSGPQLPRHHGQGPEVDDDVVDAQQQDVLLVRHPQQRGADAERLERTEVRVRRFVGLTFFLLAGYVTIQAAVILASFLLNAANADKPLPRKPFPTEPNVTDPFAYPNPDDLD